jgi:hypothetical protein
VSPARPGPAGGAQRLLAFPMAVANTHLILTGLLTQQQGTHQGAPGGLGNPLDANERAILLKHVLQFKPVGGDRGTSSARRNVDVSLHCARGGSGTRVEPGTLMQGGALFSLVPLVWESNPKFQGVRCKTQPPDHRGV